jgi:transposase
VAGESVATDQNRCQLKPLRRGDYYPIEFTDAQWSALEATFPTGVCDWGRPGVSQQDTIPWLTYQEPSGRVIYGGERLGAAPDGSGAGWTSPAFSSWRRAGG